jgi:hypothetical protein
MLNKEKYHNLVQINKLMLRKQYLQLEEIGRTGEFATMGTSNIVKA